VNDILILPDGATVGTGLQIPVRLSDAFPLYESSGPMLTDAQIEDIAKSGTARGRDRFDESWIGNQRDKGSCNGWAGAKVLQRARVRRGLPRVNLSGAYLYSLINGGRDNGSMLDDGMAAIQSRGVATEETVPWDRIYPSQYDRAKADAEAVKYKGFECYAVRTRAALFSALALGFDCVVAVHADNGFMQVDADAVAGGGNGPGNHAVGADGIYWSPRRNRPVADGYNSWSLTYGVRGRMGLDWNAHFAPTTQYHQFFACRSTTDGGDSFPPAA
jgi:hypothetical protein